MFMFNFKVPLAWWVKVTAHCHMKVVHVREIVGACIAKMNVVKIAVTVAIGCVLLLSQRRLPSPLFGKYEQWGCHIWACI